MKSNAKDLVQSMVVNTSFFPLTYFYRKVYDLSIAIAVRLLRQIDGVVAIYLRRGAARGEIIYGLSDIDLLLLVQDQDEDKKGESVKEKVRATYDRLSRFLLLFGSGDKELGVYSLSEFRGLYQDYDFYRYRFNDGKYNWKLLYGQDIVKALPQVEKTQLYLPATEELKTWWDFLKVEFTPDFDRSRVKRKYLWYKAIAEAARIYLLVCCGKNIQSREAALREIKDYMPYEYHQLINEIQGYPRRLNSKEDLPSDELMALFVILTGETLGGMERKVYGDKKGKTALIRIPDSNESIVNPELANRLQEFDVTIREELAPYLDNIALIPQVEFHVDALENTDIDSFHLVFVQKSLIPAKILRKVHSLFGQILHPQNIEPFIVFNGEVAFSLQANRPHHCIKSLGTSPLFFSLLSASTSKSPEITVEAVEGTARCQLPPYTFEETIRKRVAKIDAAISNKNIYKVKTLDFARFFWAAARTKLLARALNTEELYIPLNSRQILEILIKSFPDDSDWLKSFHSEYTEELLGKESESYRFLTKSLALLNSV